MSCMDIAGGVWSMLVLAMYAGMVHGVVCSFTVAGAVVV